MVTFPICTLAIHPFIWGGADVAGDCLWTNDTHITLMCYQLSYPYIFCTHYPQYNSPSPYIYILYLVTRRRDVFVSWGRVWFSLWPRWAWRTLKTNLHFQRLLEGNEFQLASKTNCLLYKNLAAAQEILVWRKNINREKLMERSPDGLE